MPCKTSPSDGLLRTDLALESAASLRSHGALPDGISVDDSKCGGFYVTDVRITDNVASEAIGKPMGRYITLEPELPLCYSPKDSLAAERALAGFITSILGSPEKVLVVGLGNSSVTADSLGPRVSSHIFATRHIPLNAPKLNYDGLKSVSVLTPGVMGDTGFEPIELILPLVRSIKPEAVIAIDALACANASHLGKTVQITDTGISPGSGVMNKRSGLSQKTLGVPTVAIGVPTVSTAGSDPALHITAKNIDKLVSMSASLISSGINISLHPGLEPDELKLLTS